MRASLAIVIVVATAACFDMPPRPQATGSGAVDAPIGGGGDAALHDAGAFSSDAAFGHVNIAFVTSKGFVPGGLSGPDGGDTACMAFAVAAGFPGTYVAWLAASTRNATTKLGTSRGWVRPDGLPVVDTIADLTAGKIMYPIAIDDAGSDHTADTNTVVVTGASANGSATTSTCTNFTTTTGQVTCGVPNATTTVWTTQIVTSCANANRLYCFGVGIEQEVDPPPAPPDAHIAFISANGFQVTGGLPAADSLCQTEATAATLPGSYIALLASATASAASRVTPAIYVRPDGVTIGPLTNAVITPINVTAAGAYIEAAVWTGATNPNTPFTSPGSSASTCSNWTNSTLTGTIATTVAGPAFFDGQVASECADTTTHLYCAQQ